MRKPVSRACDACRRRKIKCNGLQPCPACTSATLACTFRHEQRKGGNQGPRATVLNELRSTSSGSDVPNVLPTNSFSAPPADLVNVCIETYLHKLYPIVPFLNRELLENEAQSMHHSKESRMFVSAFCAYVATFGPASEGSFTAYDDDMGANLGQSLLDQSLSMLPGNRASFPTYRSVFISFFLYGAYAGLGMYRQGWFYLREATTLFMMCEKGPDDDLYSSAVVRRLFWILLISERAHGIRRNRPITLQITASTPPLDTTEDPQALQHLVRLLQPFNDSFFAVWDGAAQQCDKAWLLEFETKIRDALPESLHVTNEQAANLKVSQLWLRIKLWELFPRFGFLSSASAHDCLLFSFPISVARDMAFLGMTLPIESMQIHGVGMTEKIFDIACALSDIIPFISGHGTSDAVAIEYLRQLIILLTKLPRGGSRFVPLLLIKVQEVLPNLVHEIRHMEHVSQLASPTASARNLYEEEVGSLHAHLQREYGGEAVNGDWA